MLEAVLKILTFAVSGALIFLLGHSIGKARGYGEGYEDATKFHGFKRDPSWENHRVGMGKKK